MFQQLLRPAFSVHIDAEKPMQFLPQAQPAARDAAADSTAASGEQPPGPRVMLLCGADLVESFATPGVWRREHLEQILGRDHGVVCIAR